MINSLDNTSDRSCKFRTKIRLKYLINQEGRIIPIVALGLKLQY